MTKQPIDYCSIEPDFPKDAFFGMLPMKINGKLCTYPVGTLFSTLKEAAFIMGSVVSEVIEDNQIEVAKEMSLIGIHFKSLIPHVKEFWDSPDYHFDTNTRMVTFHRIIHFPTSYDVLITPRKYDKKKRLFEYTPAIPLDRTDDNAEKIDFFMKHSDFIVSPVAASSAIYSIESTIKFNWFTHKFQGVGNG